MRRKNVLVTVAAVVAGIFVTSQRSGVAMLTQRAHLRRKVGVFDRRLKRVRGDLVDRYGEKAAEAMHQEMLDEYRRLTLQAPYIGGRGNPFAGNMVGGCSALAVYRVVLDHNGNLEDTGELLHRTIRAEVEGIPQALRPWMVRYMFSGLRRRQLERGARRSQARRYPGDWVFEVVPGDGKDFDLGVDMIECGIVKFLHAQGADELTPYLCDWDYLYAEVLGYRLERTKTLAWGCDRCDFRSMRNGHMTAAWPPPFIERNCGQAR